MQNPRQILIVGNSSVLSALAVLLRASPALHVTRQTAGEVPFPPAEPCPDVILVDAAEVTPEQFAQLLSVPSAPPILSVDPETYQLTVLSSPRRATELAETARVIRILSLALPQAI